MAWIVACPACCGGCRSGPTVLGQRMPCCTSVRWAVTDRRLDAQHGSQRTPPVVHTVSVLQPVSPGATLHTCALLISQHVVHGLVFGVQGFEVITL